MTVSCPECQSVFRVDPAKVPATGVRARCSVCGGIIAIAGGTLPVSVTPAATSAIAAASPASVAPRPAIAAIAATAPAAPTPRQVTPLQVPSVPAAAMPAPAVPGAMPGRQTPLRSTPLRVTPLRSAAVTPAIGGQAVPASAQLSAPPVVPAPAAGHPLPSSAGRPAQVGTPGRGVFPIGTPSVGAARQRGTPAVGAAPVQGTPAEGKRPINPFLRTDPAQRARRLARALVSDLVAYHPQKREDGLRDGNLRQLFREEIKKSYEEYVEQVGRETAESAPHFQDALNDILSGGRRIF